jgi:ABC-2 type transport system ATP-binding protein
VEPAISLDGLVVRHGGLLAVDQLSFEVAPGEVLALLGPNGAGKTSTVETLEGYRAPSSGRVRVLGLDPVVQRSALAGRIGVMLQQGGVYPTMTPAQALRLFASYYPRAREPDELLDQLGLQAVRATPWRRLSGGEQQRVSFALALIGIPSVLFLDEPTAGVDLHGRHAIRALIHEQAASGVSVLVTTHEMAEAEAVADRVAIMHHGRLAKIGTLAELTGGGIFFTAPPNLDLASLGALLGATVTEELPGRYGIAAETSPELVADLGRWLASKDATLGELRSGASLEDSYVAIVGERAHEPTVEPAHRRHRRRS